MENGSTKLSVDFLVKVANALDVTADQLLCDSLNHSDKVFQENILESLRDCSNQELRIINQLVTDTKINLRRNLGSKA